MSQQVTNRKASQALNGQAVIVTLDETDAAYLDDFSEGMLCTHDSTQKTGTIHSVDTLGNSFKVSPIQLNRDFGLYGYLAVSDTVTVTL